MEKDDFFSKYLTYSSSTEVPAFFSRWAAITGIGAFLGRSFYLEHGNFNINPNIYCMLIGSPGTRKGTAIKIMRRLLESAGYHKFAAERTSKEKFLLDLAGEGESGTESAEDFLEKNLFGDTAKTGDDCEVFIAIDEINDFIGNGNIEFISMLGNMWDYAGLYKNRIKTGKSVEILNPTISIIGGNTPTGFAQAFPPEIIGQGFFSRLLLVYGEPNGRRIAFPKRADPEQESELIRKLCELKQVCMGPCTLTITAERLLEKIYSGNPGIDDVRFASYFNRRFPHLLKLCLITAASRASRELTEADVIYANTILSFTERLMPKALGEFGKSKNSDISHKVLSIIEGWPGVIKWKDIWAHVHSDLEKMGDLSALLQNLLAADKIQSVPGGEGFLPKKKVLLEYTDGTVDYSLISEEEKRISL